MIKSRCSLAYHELENGLINDFGTGVKNGIKNNPTIFTDPPFTEEEMDGFINTYSDKYDLWKDGGNDQRGPFLDAKTALMEALDEIAKYVDIKANGNETIIVAGGFTATKTTRQQKPEPGIPAGVKVISKGNGIIETECNRVEFAEFYGAVCSTSATSLNSKFQNGQFNFSQLNGLFILVDVNKDRVKGFSGLTGGTNYYIQFFCGNGKGVSLLSEPVRIMATE